MTIEEVVCHNASEKADYRPMSGCKQIAHGGSEV